MKMLEKLLAVVGIGSVFLAGGFYVTTNHRLNKLEEKQIKTDDKIDAGFRDMTTKIEDIYKLLLSMNVNHGK